MAVNAALRPARAGILPPFHEIAQRGGDLVLLGRARRPSIHELEAVDLFLRELAADSEKPERDDQGIFARSEATHLVLIHRGSAPSNEKVPLLLIGPKFVSGRVSEDAFPHEPIQEGLGLVEAVVLTNFNGHWADQPGLLGVRLKEAQSDLASFGGLETPTLV